MAQQETRNSWRWLWISAALLACGLGLFFLLRTTRSVVTVRTALIERHDILSTVSTNGKVEPTEDFQAHAAGPGTVQKLFVTLGEKVRAGQELVKMDDTEARRQVAAAEANRLEIVLGLNNMKIGGNPDEILGASADMTAAQTQLSRAQNSLESLIKLQAQGAAAPNEVTLARQRLADAEARIAQLQARKTGRYPSADLTAQQAQVHQADALLDTAHNALSNVDIRAPFAGTVYSIPISQYDYVNPGEILLDVADLTRLQIRAYFDEPEIGKLSIGESVKIVWDAKPNLVWHGHILQAPTTIITYGTRNVGECLITVDDARGDLLPNTNVTVTVTTMHKENVLSLPREALHTEGTNNFVYKIVNDALVKTAVQVGVVSLTRVEVIEGLSEGEAVALGATTDAELTDGLRVKAQP